MTFGYPSITSIAEGCAPDSPLHSPQILAAEQPPGWRPAYNQLCPQGNRRAEVSSAANRLGGPAKNQNAPPLR